MMFAEWGNTWWTLGGTWGPQACPNTSSDSPTGVGPHNKNWRFPAWLPIAPGFAHTTHFVQGTTLETATVDLGTLHDSGNMLTKHNLGNNGTSFSEAYKEHRFATRPCKHVHRGQ